MRRLMAILLGCTAAGPALAADDLVLIGGGRVIADGESPTVLHLWSPEISYDAKVKVKASVGKATVVENRRTGVSTIQLVLPELEGPQDLTLEVTVKRPGSSGTSGTFTVHAVPAWSGPLVVSLEPESLRLGDESGVLVRIKAPPSPQDDEDRRLRLHASIGKVDSPIATGDGSFVARWTPPRSLDGSVTVTFTVTDLAAPREAMGFGTLPVLVQKRLSYEVEPGSTNMLQVGADQYGPLQANSKGIVTFEVTVDPRSPKGSLQSVGANQRFLDLELGDFPRLSWVPVPEALPADPKLAIPLQVVAVARDGRPHGGNPPALSCEGATVSTLQPTELPGLYQAELTPPAAQGPLTCTATLDDQQVAISSRFTGGLPRATIVAEPLELEPRDRDVSYVATLTGPDGSPLNGAVPEVIVAGGVRSTRPLAMGEGRYSWKARRASGSNQVVVVAEAPVSSTGLPASSLLIWPAEGRIPTGAAEHSTLVLAAAVDAFGNPVPDVPLSFTVVEGVGAITPAARTNARGIAKVEYTAGNDAGPGVLRVEGAGLLAEGVVFTSDDEDGPSSRPVGSPRQLELLERWSQVAAVSLVREKRPEPVVVAAVSPVSADGTPTSGSPTPAEDGTTDAATTLPKDRSEMTERERTARIKAEGPALARGGRVAFSAASVPHHYEASAPDTARVPEEMAFQNGDLFSGDLEAGLGGDVRALIWVKDLGIDLRGRLYTETTSAPEDDFQQFNWSAMAGVRSRYQVTPAFGLYGGLGLERTGLDLYPWGDDDRGSNDIHRMNVFGARLATGFMVEAGRFYLDVELAETLVPYPVDTHLGGLVAVTVSDALAVHAGLELDLRSFTVEAWGDEVKIKEQEQALLLGVTALIP